MRKEQEVSHAIERYSDMIMRLCAIYLKNDSETERIFKKVFLNYALGKKSFSDSEQEKIWFIQSTIKLCKWSRWWHHSARFILNRDMAMKAVWELSIKEREVIYLHVYEGYTIPKISKILKKNQNVISTHLENAQNILNQSLQNSDAETPNNWCKSKSNKEC